MRGIFNFLKPKKKPLAIAAIFRNEKEYILEWLAWHLSQGIESFIIYDNESDDGTTELLQQLASKSIIELHSIPQQEKAQLIAYDEIIRNYKNKFELIAFIDADEFMMPMDNTPAATHIFNLFKNKNIGALGINWKVFGTNGHQSKPDGHVLLNYFLAGNDDQPRNHYIKSVYRPEAVIKIFPHRAVLKESYRYINAENRDMVFSTLENLPNPTKNNQTTGVSNTVCATNLRINHYALKSVDEFVNKKKHKGGVMKGKGHVKSDSYFREFDLNDEKILIGNVHIQAFTKEYEQLKTKFSTL